MRREQTIVGEPRERDAPRLGGQRPRAEGPRRGRRRPRRPGLVERCEPGLRIDEQPPRAPSTQSLKPKRGPDHSTAPGSRPHREARRARMRSESASTTDDQDERDGGGAKHAAIMAHARGLASFNGCRAKSRGPRRSWSPHASSADGMRSHTRDVAPPQLRRRVLMKLQVLGGSRVGFTSSWPRAAFAQDVPATRTGGSNVERTAAALVAKMTFWRRRRSANIPDHQYPTARACRATISGTRGCTASRAAGIAPPCSRRRSAWRRTWDPR